MNVTSFVANKALNILLFNSFFKKSCIFRENGEKPFLGDSVPFEGKGASVHENECVIIRLHTHGPSVLITALIQHWYLGKLHVYMFCRKVAGIREQYFKKILC